ncbi:MAG TPA: hypothetical protein VFC68_06900, partial [Treponemataceae bacterium]|nr:hypothetical protein [Treponemataceae bacterium]
MSGIRLLVIKKGDKMKNILEKIKNVNAVIIFIAIVGFLLFFIIGAIISFIPRRSSNVVRIVNKEDSQEIVQTVKFQTVIKDYIVFSHNSNSLYRDKRVDLEFSGLMEKSYNNTARVNFSFISMDTQKETLLLKNNALIISYKLCNDMFLNNNKTISKNIYAIVLSDSNQDQKLNADDRIDLFISDYNGLNIKNICSDIY